MSASSGSGLAPHTIVALVKDRPGVLSRIAGCLTEKGFNIRSLAVGASEQPGLSRMTFVVDASTDAEQMVAELRKLEDVTEIKDISDYEFVSRELALVRVRGEKEVRKRLMDIVETFGARVIDVGAQSMIIEVTGHENKIDSLVRLLQDYDVVELVRTGRVSMLKGALPSFTVSEPLEIAGLTLVELQAAAKAHLSRGAGLASVIYRDALARGRFEPTQHGLGAQAAGAWHESFALSLPKLVRVVEEETALGSVAKAVLALHDGLEIECVLLPMGHERSTLCVSSQVGCKMGCTFCETGRMGLLRNLTTAEIVGQLLCARHVLGWAYNNVVFMGMGEALDNRDAVLQALRVMTDGGGFAMGQEHITVCTVGNVPGIEALGAAGFKRLNLSVSLNAARDELRSQLMPVNRRTPLAELQRALSDYRPRANFALGVNYCLLPGINDARQDASDVARFCAPLGRVMVNVIPYNPGGAPIAPAPSEEAVDLFIGWLREEGVPVRRRITKGRSVMAACGQLGNVQLRRRRTIAGATEM